MKKYIYIILAMVMAVACTQKSVVIVQIADAQLGFDAAVKGSVPGAEYVNDLTFEVECLKATVAKVNELKPDMVVFTGDQVHLPYDKEQWDAFMEGIADIDPSIEQYHLRIIPLAPNYLFINTLQKPRAPLWQHAVFVTRYTSDSYPPGVITRSARVPQIPGRR